MYKRLLGSLALTVIPVAILTACGGGGGQSGLTPMGARSAAGPSNSSPRMKPMEITPNDLHAGGGPFPMWVYNGNSQPEGLASNGFQPLPSPTSLFALAPLVGNVYYCETGSDFGKGVYDGANSTLTTAACAALGQSPTGFGSRLDPPDFAGTDVPFGVRDFLKYRISRFVSNGNPVEVPMVAGPITFGYNTGDFSGVSGRIKLSRWTYCAIANGTVTDWNDPAITADNGGSVTGGTSQPLTFVYRSDADGTNLQFQAHLNNVCGYRWVMPYNAAPYQTATRNAAWRGGRPTETWTGPIGKNFVAASGPDAQISTIQSTVGATGDVDGPLGAADGLNAALLQNNHSYISWGAARSFFADSLNPTNLRASVANASLRNGEDDNGSIGVVNSACIAFVKRNSYVDPDSAKAYPIVEISYGLFYQKNNAHFADVKNLLTFVNTNSGSVPAAGTSDAIVLGAGYTPLPGSIKSIVRSYIIANNQCLKN